MAVEYVCRTDCQSVAAQTVDRVDLEQNEGHESQNIAAACLKCLSFSGDVV